MFVEAFDAEIPTSVVNLNIVDIQCEISALRITNIDAIPEPIVYLSVVVHAEERSIDLLYLNPRYVVTRQRVAGQVHVLTSRRMHVVQRVWKYFTNTHPYCTVRYNFNVVSIFGLKFDAGKLVWNH